MGFSPTYFDGAVPTAAQFTAAFAQTAILDSNNLFANKQTITRTVTGSDVGPQLLELNLTHTGGGHAFPWPLRINSVSDHASGDQVGIYVNLVKNGDGWSAAYHADVVHQSGAGAPATTIGLNLELYRSSAAGFVYGGVIQNSYGDGSTGLKADAGLIFQSAGSAYAFDSGIRFDGNPGSAFFGDYAIDMNGAHMGVGAIRFPDGTVQTTAAGGGGGGYPNLSVSSSGGTNNLLTFAANDAQMWVNDTDPTGSGPVFFMTNHNPVAGHGPTWVFYSVDSASFAVPAGRMAAYLGVNTPGACDGTMELSVAYNGGLSGVALEGNHARGWGVVKPVVNSAWALGDATHKWKELFVAEGADFGGNVHIAGVLSVDGLFKFSSANVQGTAGAGGLTIPSASTFLRVALDGVPGYVIPVCLA